VFIGQCFRILADAWVICFLVVVAIVYGRVAACSSETSSMKINWLWDSELMLGVASVNGARTDLAVLDIYKLMNNFITLCGIVWLHKT
jgi:hypothetical protein